MSTHRTIKILSIYSWSLCLGTVKRFEKVLGETNGNKNKLATPNISAKQIFLTERNQFQLLFSAIFFLFSTWYYFVHRLLGASHLNSTAFSSPWSSLGATPWQYRGIEAQRQLHNQCKKFCKFHTLLLAKKEKKNTQSPDSVIWPLKSHSNPSHPHLPPAEDPVPAASVPLLLDATARKASLCRWPWGSLQTGPRSVTLHKRYCARPKRKEAN